MKTYSLRFLFFVISFTYTGVGHSQHISQLKSSTIESLRNIPPPLFIVNSIIIGGNLWEQIKTDNIKDLSIHRPEDSQGIFKNLSSAAIIAVVYNGKLNSISFSELAIQRGLHGPLKFVLDGYPLDAAQLAALRIAPEAIGNLHITPPASEGQVTTVDIQLAKQQATARKYSPGTIMIR